MTSMTGSVQQLNTLMTDLRSVVMQLDVPLNKPQLLQKLNGRLVGLRRLADEIRQNLPDAQHENFRPIADALEHFKEVVGHELDRRWDPTLVNALKAKLADRYEHILNSMRNTPDFRRLGLSLPTLRPTNYARNIYHVANGLLGVALYEWVFSGQSQTAWCLVGLLVFYMALDQARRFSPRFNRLLFDSVFAAITRPRERYETPSGIWYVAGLLGAVVIASQTYAQVAVIALAVGDPAASVVGKRWGRRKLYRDRSVLGTLAFIGATLLVAYPFLVGVKGLSPLHGVGIALAAGVAGAAIELFATDRLDDNVLIPVGVAAILTIFC
ncbi:MAG: hypothetical protein VX589_06555 [Myxococcota bacterium]|nr:hypothetical protein [Myxococcota bacterium]